MTSPALYVPQTLAHDRTMVSDSGGVWVKGLVWSLPAAAVHPGSTGAKGQPGVENTGFLSLPVLCLLGLLLGQLTFTRP